MFWLRLRCRARITWGWFTEIMSQSVKKNHFFLQRNLSGYDRVKSVFWVDRKGNHARVHGKNEHGGGSLYRRAREAKWLARSVTSWRNLTGRRASFAPGTAFLIWMLSWVLVTIQPS